jgi:hypothetical protein
MPSLQSVSSPRPVLKKTFGAASALEALVEESKKQLLQLNDVKNKLVEELESAHKINRKLGKHYTGDTNTNECVAPARASGSNVCVGHVVSAACTRAHVIPFLVRIVTSIRCSLSRFISSTAPWASSAASAVSLSRRASGFRPLDPFVLPGFLHVWHASPLLQLCAELRCIELEEQLELRDRMELRAAAAAAAGNPVTAASLSAPAMPVAASAPMPVVVQPAAHQPTSVPPPAPAPKPAAPAAKTVTLTYFSGWDTVYCHYNLNNKGERQQEGQRSCCALLQSVPQAALNHAPVNHYTLWQCMVVAVHGGGSAWWRLPCHVAIALRPHLVNPSPSTLAMLINQMSRAR